jgi:predicted ester cyclase
MSSDPKEIVREYLERAFVRHEMDQLEELVSTEALIQAAKGFVSAFPDVEMKFEHTIGEGDWVAAGVTASGTHKAPFRGHPPTGNRWEARATAWYQVTDRKISNSWIVWDWLPIMEAVGAVGSSQPPVGQHP